MIKNLLGGVKMSSQQPFSGPSVGCLGEVHQVQDLSDQLSKLCLRYLVFILVNYRYRYLSGQCCGSTSVPDPDPPRSEIIWPPGSGSKIINFGSGSGSGSGSFPFSHQT